MSKTEDCIFFSPALHPRQNAPQKNNVAYGFEIPSIYPAYKPSSLLRAYTGCQKNKSKEVIIHYILGFYSILMNENYVVYEERLGENIMTVSKAKTVCTLFLCIVFIVCITEGTAKAYYGSGLGSSLYGLYGGGYGSYGGYGGLYGGGLYSSYGGYGGLYGGGLYGSYGGYGGLYGGGLYGSYGSYGGLYGGGLYGSYGGYGGLYGSMYGMGGLMVGLYGSMFSPFGLQNMYLSISTGNGLNYQVPFMQGAPLLGIAGLYNSLFPNLFNSVSPSPAAIVAAEQAGTWEGLWSSGAVSGPMTLNLIEDPIFGTLTGFVQLLGNPTLGSLVDVTGEVLNNQIFVSGSGIGLGGMTFKIDVTGTLTSPETMTGNYTLINSTSVVETGSFELALIPPIIL